MFDKLKVVVDLISKNNLDGILLTSEINRYWFLDFKSSWGYLFINNSGKSIFLIDSRYFFAAIKEIKNVNEIILLNGNLKNKLNEIISKLNIKKLGIESEHCLVNEYDFLKSLNVNITPCLTNELRITKTKNELDKLQIAADIASETINWIKEIDLIGKTEKEVAKLISIHMLELGASGNSFDPIVASGKNGAVAHHSPTNKIIEDGDMLTIDIGCIYENYCSDITRSFIVGTNYDPEMIKIYECVLNSQLQGIEMVQLGKTGNDIDKICRDYIIKNNYGQYFTHSTGHGVGIQVHELPNISPNSKFIIKPNYVFTIEPGIYIENFGGVRIEDTVYIDEENQVHILTKKANKNIFQKN